MAILWSNVVSLSCVLVVLAWFSVINIQVNAQTPTTQATTQRVTTYAMYICGNTTCYVSPNKPR